MLVPMNELLVRVCTKLKRWKVEFVVFVAGVCIGGSDGNSGWLLVLVDIAKMIVANMFHFVLFSPVSENYKPLLFSSWHTNGIQLF